MKRLDIDLDDLRERYGEGESEKSLAESYGVSRNVIRLRLLELGIEPRGRGAAMSIRMASISPDERKRLARAANTARRGSTVSEAEMERKALWRQDSARFATADEVVLRSWIEKQGRHPMIQTAAGRYNLDLSIGSVAVELHRTSSNPARMSRTRERAEYLLDRGWSVIYVWVNGSFVLSERAADEVVAFAESAERLPTGVREYRVVRGTGEHVTCIRFDDGERAVIPTPKAHLRTRRDH